MICGDCIHKEVCGLEGHFDDALITCTHKTELPHNTGHWIFKHFDEDTGISDSYWCSECNKPLVSAYKNFCPNCGCRMVEPQEREDKGVLEQLAEKQNNLSATNKAWSDVIEKNGYVN